MIVCRCNGESLCLCRCNGESLYAPSCSLVSTENWHSHDFFGKMPSIPHVPVAESSTVTMQGRLSEYSDFLLTEVELSDFVKGIV